MAKSDFEVGSSSQYVQGHGCGANVGVEPRIPEAKRESVISKLSNILPRGADAHWIAHKPNYSQLSILGIHSDPEAASHDIGDNRHTLVETTCIELVVKAMGQVGLSAARKKSQ